MYNIKLANYVPEPKPATSDRIVAAHYYAAWKKGAAGLHEGFDDLHDFPERTPLMGYYDEGIPEVADWEIKFLVEHGYDFQHFCWYLGNGASVIKEPRLADAALHDGYFNAKYSDMLDYIHNNVLPYVRVGAIS